MSDRLVRYEVEGGVGVITIDNPPVNALAPGVREGIMEAVAAGNADAGVAVLVLMGTGRHFIAGADIRQFGKVRPVSTRTSAAALDESVKPLVAAIHGHALGGGLEHALACHYRIATRSAKVGLPETTLGIIPAGGGTQRLTRLIGPAAALDMLLSGRPVTADEALRLGIVDALFEEEGFRAAALRYAADVAAVRPLRRVRDLEAHVLQARADAGVMDALRKKTAAKSRHLAAPRHVLAAVEAAVTLPFDEGIALEKASFELLENADEAKALRYAFFAEREAAKIPGAPVGFRSDPVTTAAVIGAGTMGGGIAMCYADVGIPVKVVDVSQEGLDRGMARLRETYAVRVKRRSLTQAAMDERLALIQPVLGYDDIGACDVVVEAVFERIDLKKEVFTKLDAVMKPGALLLTNSSAIDINVMADATKRPQDVAGAHFFAPANVMKLCEVVRGDRTSIDTVIRTTRMGRDMGKISVVSGTCDGFAANRSRAPLVTEMMLMLEEGALPEQVDRVMVDFGYPMGPFAVSDLSGLDVSYDTRKRRAAADPNFRKLHVPDRLVEMGRKGQKTGAGWYRYVEGDRTPHPDDAVRRVIEGVAKDLGIAQRTFTDEEILHRMLFASVNEACKILDEGRAYRASDIDVMWLHGFGFPRHRGGLMFWADGIGAVEIRRRVSEWHAMYGRRWTPSPLLQRCADTGASLRELTAAV